MVVLSAPWIIEFEFHTFPKAVLLNTVCLSFFVVVWFGNKDSDSQQEMEAHSPSLHVYTTVMMLAKVRGKKNKNPVILMLLDQNANMKACTCLSVLFSNLFEAHDQKGLKE